MKVYSVIDDPDFAFEDEEDEEDEDEYDNNDDGSWPKHYPHYGAPRRSTTIVKNPNPNTTDDQFDKLDGDFNEDEADEN